MPDQQVPSRRCDITRDPQGGVIAHLSGDWRLAGGIDSNAALRKAIDATPPPPKLVLQADRIGTWDSSLPAFLMPAVEACRDRNIEVDDSGLPEGARRLLRLAMLVPERDGTAKSTGRGSLVAAVGRFSMAQAKLAMETVSFLGEVAIAFGHLLRRRARFPLGDFFLLLQECGAAALPIVSIISLLIGMILAFVGAVELKQFGAQIYVANLVGIAMAREMGAVMTGIVLAGRTGAAFAARLGAMQGNEEIDALSVLGISPVEYLVLPRMIALILMTPLLCLYADTVGMLGGYIVGAGMLDLNGSGYLIQTMHSVTLTELGIGIGKSVVFGCIVALAGCWQGMRCGRSAAAVGNATTAAVVQGILFIIIADGVFAVLFQILDL
jgi:phospholipid/cholesterol/gamma-HCH transport system permease protein